MKTTLQKIFAGLLQTEENFAPIFIKSPGAQTIAAAVLVTESEFASIFGVNVPVAPTPTPVPTAE